MKTGAQRQAEYEQRLLRGVKWQPLKCCECGKPCRGVYLIDSLPSCRDCWRTLTDEGRQDCRDRVYKSRQRKKLNVTIRTER
jgi:hypothetical protein